MKTAKGTELPLINLKGKEYLQVAHRLVWFREERPDWSIETEFLQLTDTHSIAKATIRNEQGRVIATGHKREDAKHFADHNEKSETGAIGRALALCGFGTQFAPDLDEAERIVDSPVQRPAATQMKVVNQVQQAFPSAAVVNDSHTLGDYVATFGKYKGQPLRNFEIKELQQYCSWLKDGAKKDNKPIRGQVEEFIRAVDGYAQESQYQV